MRMSSCNSLKAKQLGQLSSPCPPLQYAPQDTGRSVAGGAARGINTGGIDETLPTKHIVSCFVIVQFWRGPGG
eukprot:1406814-Pleurochrysis_carterae.AAC.3